MEKIFRVMRCPDAMKLVYSVYMLEEEVKDWWTNTVQPLEAEGRQITWRLFETLFLDNYFPREAREQKQNEYNDLKERSMSIDQYFAKFNELVKYANYGRALPTPAEMTFKFQWGLNEKMSQKMSNCDIREFSKFVNQCRKVEEVYNVAKSKKSSGTQASGASGATDSTLEKNKKIDDKNGKKKLQAKQSDDKFKRKGNQGETVVSEFPLSKCDTCGKTHRGTCWYETKSCFKCGQLGHFANVCPTRTDRISNVHAIVGSRVGGQDYTLEPHDREETLRQIEGMI
ncbi:uncharacterized protein LOC133298337 [Gastrolobium bilobum]|uniref:uncharacterized protein LOC133298337 n=2 Tax=Gastrolobium bilobum TaxID=150636 RepID=UPI002AB2B8AB|nr:uncharacterized protein LOC133298337 [Gastrolobium bilobum]